MQLTLFLLTRKLSPQYLPTQCSVSIWIGRPNARNGGSACARALEVTRGVCTVQPGFVAWTREFSLSGVQHVGGLVEMVEDGRKDEGIDFAIETVSARQSTSEVARIRPWRHGRHGGGGGQLQRRPMRGHLDGADKNGERVLRRQGWQIPSSLGADDG